ncbi:SAM-dependent chlorinase/fluorinase [Salinirubellus salinus]|uniref:SAM-dependent chlorinase/fluorinase n=1 Tax=Salinirubellus salinus TaxID=1364945 RepID=A0A9E7UBH9_9EURY|nr:SAM-dependent chlorinase/fluorinase [Salinirubellus salinus]UWM54799.1 SAM-dependent chlorinase/fluorinase [Salinirubellus salinus]
MITLSSDFGSPYPAAMKGVLLQHTAARLVDVSHEFPRQDVRTAAFWLREVLPYFPPAVHLAVVDPGVGTDRGALVVRAGEHALVAPDNGLVLPVARRLAAVSDAEDATVEVFEWAYDDPASHTFHGRDVFAPCAAAVHEVGIDRLETLDAATPADEYEDRTFPEPTLPTAEAEAPRGEVLVVDGFGNVVTNLPASVLEGHYGAHVTVHGTSGRVARAYDEVDPGTRVVTVGSHGNVELAVNRGRGDSSFGLEPGDEVRLSF